MQNQNSKSNIYAGFGSPHHHSMKQVQSGSPYLPGFLLGQSPQVSHQEKSLLSTSNYNTSKVQSKWSSKSPPHVTRMPYSSPEQTWKRTSPKSTSPLSHTRSSLKDRHGGPPVEGLFSPVKSDDFTMETELSMKPSIYNSPHEKEMFSATSFASPNMKRRNLFHQNNENIPQSPAQMDPFYTQGDDIHSSDILDDTSVTVFGFPAAAATFILQQFSQYGTIEKYEMHNTGNWLHIKYKTRLQAKKALSKNGKIFSRTIMIGVLPCVKKYIAEADVSVNQTNLDHQTTMDKSVHLMRPLSTSSLSVVGNNNTTPMRNLSTAGNISSEKGTPQKQNSVVTKALDYVFGW